MRTLIIFVAVCLVMVGLLVWQLVTASHVEAPARTAAQPAVQPEEGPRLIRDDAMPAQEAEEGPRMVADEVPAEAVAPQAVAEPGAVGAPEVAKVEAETRWPEDPALRRAQQRLEEAREMLRADPLHEAALRDAAAALAQLERWDEVAVTLENLRTVRPEDSDLCREHASVLMQLGRAVEAIGVLNELVAMMPEDAQAWFNLAAAHQTLGHLSAALHAWNRAIALEPTTEAYAQRGVVLLDLGRWDEAAADLERVVAADATARESVVNLAHALVRLGRTDEARERLTALAEREPTYLPAVNRLAELALQAWQAGPHDAARRAALAKWCRQSLAVDPEQKDVAGWLALTGESVED
jgi:tetratricopeptide (TPR) repeat protein